MFANRGLEKLEHFHTMEYFLLKRYICTDMQRYSKHLVKFEKAVFCIIQIQLLFVLICNTYMQKKKPKKKYILIVKHNFL